MSYTDHDRAVIDGLLRAHTPSLTERAEEMIETAELEGIRTDGFSDPADAAYRECSCGVMLEGFYAYIAHLREVIGA